MLSDKSKKKKCNIFSFRKRKSIHSMKYNLNGIKRRIKILKFFKISNYVIFLPHKKLLGNSKNYRNKVYRLQWEEIK